MYHLFLDDIRDPSWVTWTHLPRLDDREWVIVRNFDQFTHCIENMGLPSFVSFDHDLDMEGMADETTDKASLEKTGMDCAHWLVEYCLDHNQDLPDFMVHSQNPPGKANIEGLLMSFVRHQKKTLTP